MNHINQIINVKPVRLLESFKAIESAEISANNLALRVIRIKELVNSGLSFRAAVKIARAEQSLN